MKTVLLVSAMFALAVVSVQAQGTIKFNNSTTTKISTNLVVGGATLGAAGTAAGQYRYALFCSTSASSVNGQTKSIAGGTNVNYAFNDGNWTLVSYGTNSVQAGLFVSANANSSGATAVSGVAGGSAAQFVVIGWSANAGTTIAAVQSWFNGGNPAFSGWIGQSAVSGAITLGTSSATAATLFSSNAPPAIPGFILGLVGPSTPMSPVITAQPTNATAPVGVNVNFSVSATGNPSPTYQWMFNTNNAVPGATNRTLTITNVQLTNAGTYSVVISNSAGSTNSITVTLTVTNSTGNGYVVFANTSASATKIYTNSAVGGAATGLTAVGGPLYYYALYASSNAASVNGQTAAIVGGASGSYAFTDANWTFIAYGSNGTNSSSGTNSSIYRGQLLSMNADAAGRTPVPGFVGGTSVRFVVIGWSANVGNTNITAVQAWFNGGNPASDGWIGQSAVSGSLVLGNGGAIATPQLFGTAAPRLLGFTLGLVSPVAHASYSMPYAPPALMQAGKNGSNLQLSWPSASGTFSVQSADSPAGPWSDTGWTVTSDGTTSSVNVPPTDQQKFFRLVAE